MICSRYLDKDFKETVACFPIIYKPSRLPPNHDGHVMPIVLKFCVSFVDDLSDDELCIWTQEIDFTLPYDFIDITAQRAKLRDPTRALLYPVPVLITIKVWLPADTNAFNAAKSYIFNSIAHDDKVHSVFCTYCHEDYLMFRFA